MFGIFRRRLKSFWQIFSYFHFPRKIPRVFIPPNIIGGLRYCCWFVNIRFLIWWRSGGLFVPCYPCMNRYPKFLEALHRDCMRCPGNYYLCLLFSLYCDKEEIKRATFPSLRWDFFCRHVSSFCEEGINKYRE